MTNKAADEALTTDQLRDLVISTLEDLKAIDIQQIDVAGQNPLTDLFVIASGNSSRHVKSMAEKLATNAKAAGCQPLGIEGEREGEWVLASSQQRSSAGRSA